MPLRNEQDSNGKYYRWGNSSKRWYYTNETERKQAKRHAIIQAYAIEKSKERKGKENELASSGTGRKTELVGINSPKSRHKSKSKTHSRSKSHRRSKISGGFKSKFREWLF